MVNTKAKGDRAEAKAKKLLEEKGYEVEKPIKTRWGRTDFFNKWDLIAVNDEHVRFIQVKTNKNDTYGKQLDKYRGFPAPPNTTRELWLMEARKQIKIIDLDAGLKTKKKVKKCTTTE